MKKNLMLLFLTILLTSCGLFHTGTHMNKNVEFIFVDSNGKDIFAESLSTDDFHITSIEGYAALNRIDTIHGKHYVDILFGEGDDKKSTTLLHFKDDVDTVEVTFKRHKYSIQDLYYNGQLIVFESDISSYCTIVK